MRRSFLVLLLFLLCAAHLSSAQRDTLTLTNVHVQADAASVNLCGVLIDAEVSWNKDVETSHSYTLSLTLKTKGGKTVAYRLPDQADQFLDERIVVNFTGEDRVFFFIPYNQLDLPQGRHELTPSFTATSTDEKVPAPLLQSPAPEAFPIAQPKLVKARVEVQKLQIRAQDAFGRPWDTAGASGPDVTASLRSAARGYALSWHNFPRAKNTVALTYSKPSSWVYLAPQDKLDLIIWDQDFNGPETIHSFTFSVDELRRKTFVADDRGLVQHIALAFTVVD